MATITKSTGSLKLRNGGGEPSEKNNKEKIPPKLL
jgi:hypothetical protein